MKAAKITSLTVIHVILTVMALVWILPFAYVIYSLLSAETI